MKNIVITLLFILVALFNPYISRTFADTFQSNCIVNKIGNAPGSPPGCGSGGSSGGNTLISKTALALYADGSPCGDINRDTYQCFIKNIAADAHSYPDDVAAIANINYWINNIPKIYAYECINFCLRLP